MSELFASGGIADLVLVLMLAELAGLGWWLHRQGRPFPAGLVTTLASGACMIMALRGALLQQPWTSIAPWLSASFLAHGADLVVRLRRTDCAGASRPSSLGSRPA